MTDRDAILALVGRLRQFEGRDWETTVCYNGLRLEAAQALTGLLAERDELRMRLTQRKHSKRKLKP